MEVRNLRKFFVSFFVLVVVCTTGIAVAGTKHSRDSERKWWEVDLSTDTAEVVRSVLVPRLEKHQKEVARIKHEAKLAAIAAAKEAAAQAVEEAQAALDNPVPIPTETYRGCLSADQVADYARAAGFPEYSIAQMVAYAYRESHYCPGAVNDYSGACGLWQAHPCYGGEAWLDPATNARIAYQKFSAPYPGGGIYGYHPWGGSTLPG